MLPPTFERVRRKLAGADDGDRQMVGLLTAAMDDGLEAVEAACLEALEAGFHSVDVVLNILARRREPARVIPRRVMAVLTLVVVGLQMLSTAFFVGTLSVPTARFP